SSDGRHCHRQVPSASAGDRDSSRQLLEDKGLDSFSMRRLADRLGVRAPVIYKYLASKSALVAALISVGFEEQAALFEAALTSSDHPLTAMAGIYRAYGRDNPNLYRLMHDRDLDRPLLLPEARSAPSSRPYEQQEGTATSRERHGHSRTG